MDLPTMLAEAHDRRAHLETLLTERSTAAETARALLAQDSTYPRPRKEVEAELREAESDLRWIRQDLAALATHERFLEANLGAMMADEVELAAVEKARTAKAAKAQRKAAKRTKPSEGVESTSAADASEEDPAAAGA
jgi:hypothetical protein